MIGEPGERYAMGAGAEEVLNDLRRNEDRSRSRAQKTLIACSVVIDRMADPLTQVICTKTYGGILHELFPDRHAIESAISWMPADALLNDRVWEAARAQPIESVLTFLQNLDGNQAASFRGDANHVHHHVEDGVDATTQIHHQVVRHQYLIKVWCRRVYVLTVCWVCSST